MRSRRSRRTAVAGLVLGLGTSLLATAPLTASSAAPPSPAASAAARAEVEPAGGDNPLAGHKLAVYKGGIDMAWPPYANATGERKRLLGKIALRPKAAWFGAWIPNRDIGTRVHDYIANSTRNDDDAVVQMSVFRMVPWEQEACRRLPTDSESASYRTWIDRFAAAVGDTRTAIILQPDGPFALCAPGGSKKPSHLIRYAAKRFSALSRTSVYIDAGAADWPKDDPETAARIRMPAGIEHVRGFALNSTHYVSTASDIRFGTELVQVLANRGVPGKHFVINTSSNGRPFLFGDAPGPDPDNATVCANQQARKCVTLGIPPTTDVARPRWHLSEADRAKATEHVDAYLWFGRPWLYRQAAPFDMKRALSLARTTPY